jgi:uncharacterized protein
MIVALVRAGKKVGITSNSHKVIGNLISEVLKAAEATPVRVIQRVSEERQGFVHPTVRLYTDPGPMREALDSRDFDVAAGTAWLWSRDDAANAVDVLFVDEAGQVALANVLAMSGAARSIVLLGDPQQLDQPLQGTHPPGSGRSALGHLLNEQPTMPDDLGLFLEDTRRLHPDITTFTSKAFYEGRLESFAGLENQRVNGGPLDGAGIRLLAAAHVGENNESPEEADQVAELVAAIVESGATWTKANGEVCPIGWDDVLIVAPYNAQVGAIQQRLPLARVGTVDKFQGQEAPISIYSMTSSSADDAPRGMSFLYSRNRLNVATSRARCVTAVVATPALLTVSARTPEQMRLANALCEFALIAGKERREGG